MIKGEYRGASLGTLVVLLVIVVVIAAAWGLGGDADDDCGAATSTEACDEGGPGRAR